MKFFIYSGCRYRPVHCRALPGLFSFFILIFPAHSQTHDLSTLLNAGKNTDPALKAAQAQHQAEALNSDIALGKLLPQASARLNLTNTNDNSINSNYRSRLSEINLQQTLFDPVAWYEYRVAHSERALATTAFNEARQQWLLTLARTYADTLRAMAALEAADTDTRAFTEALKRASQRHDVGLVVKTEVLEASAALDAAEATAYSAQAELSLQLESLSRISGEPVTAIKPFSAAITLQLPDEQELQQWLQADGINNPQIIAAQQQRLQAQQQHKAAIAAHLPRAEFSASLSREHLSGDEQSDEDLLLLSATATLPILAGGSHYGAQKKAHWQARTAELNEDSARRTVRYELRRLLRLVRYDIQNIRGRQQAIVSATSAYNATRNAHRIGTRNMVDVLNAQRTLSAAEKEFANARCDFMVHLLELKYYAGVLDDTDMALINLWFTAQS